MSTQNNQVSIISNEGIRVMPEVAPQMETTPKVYGTGISDGVELWYILEDVPASLPDNGPSEVTLRWRRSQMVDKLFSVAMSTILVVGLVGGVTVMLRPSGQSSTPVRVEADARK